MAELRALAAQFEAMDDLKMGLIIEANMAAAARPFAPAVRAAILNTPSKGTRPWPPQVPGLRLRIARCVETWAEIHGPVVSVGVEVNASKMPDGQKALPLYLDGAKAPWRHPVFGNYEVWVAQEAHPYFAGAISAFGPATHRAVDRAVQKIADQITG